MNTKFWSENPKRRDQSVGLDVDGKIILKRIFWRKGGKVCNGLFWLRIGTSDGLS